MEISEEVKEFEHLSNRSGKNTHCIVIFIELMIYQISALKFLPDIPATRNADQANSREVVFYDKLMKAWQFKYSYWTANRTLVAGVVEAVTGVVEAVTGVAEAVTGVAEGLEDRDRARQWRPMVVIGLMYGDGWPVSVVVGGDW
ncbi:hypothetical protein ACFE04_019523 [Oxalis oulophora]